MRSFALIIQSIRSWRQVILIIISLLIIHNHDRMTSIAHVLHTTTWDYFTFHLPDRFSRSPKVVKEAIMAEVNDLMRDFWAPATDGDVGASIFAMRRLHDILQQWFFVTSEVCFDVVSISANVVDDKNPQNSANLNSRYCSAQSDLDDSERITTDFKILLHGYRKMFDQSFSKSKELGDVLRLLPGVVVQNHMSMQGMVDLYGVKPDLLARLVKSTIEPLKSSLSLYTLDDYLSGFLEDRDRSQHYYCDPMLQHISICRHFLSLMDGSNVLAHQS